MKVKEIVLREEDAQAMAGYTVKGSNPSTGEITVVPTVKPNEVKPGTNIALDLPDQQQSEGHDDDESDELADASDRELIKWASQMGLEDSVVIDGEGQLANREEIVDILRQIGEGHGDIGGDPTDDFINDIEDKDYGQQNENSPLLDAEEVFYVAQDSAGVPRLKVNGSANVESLPKIAHLPKLDMPGYDITSKGFRAISIELPGSKDRVPAFMSGQYVYANKDSFTRLQQAVQGGQTGTANVQESDAELLKKMLTIAGIR